MSAKTQSTPARALLPSPIEKTPPSSTRKRALNELSINLPPRPHSAHDFTTPEHPNTNKRYRKVSEPLMLSASSLSSSASKRESPGEDPVWGPDVEAAFMSGMTVTTLIPRFRSELTVPSHQVDPKARTEEDLHRVQAVWSQRTHCGLHLPKDRQDQDPQASLLPHPGPQTHPSRRRRLPHPRGRRQGRRCR